MENIKIGSIMREMRQERGFSKQSVSRGLCSVQGLMRFENNMRFPDKILAQRIFERLGRETEQFEMIIHDEDYELAMLWQNIQNKIRKRQYGAAEELLKAYQIPLKSQHLHKQLIKKNYGDIYYQQGKMRQAYESYKEALILTNIDPEHFENTISCMDFSEIEMLFRIAGILYSEEWKGERSTGEKLYHRLVSYFEKWESISYVLPELYGKLMLWHAKEQEKLKDFKRAQAALEKGLAVLRKQRRLEGLADLLLESCLVLEQTGRVSTEEVLIKYQQVYYFMESIKEQEGIPEKIQHLKEWVKERYQWEFTELETLSDIPEKQQI